MNGASRSRALRVWAVLTLAVLYVYAPVRSFPFVVYDDKHYVSENPFVTPGLTAEGLRWAFTHSEQGNYVPLSWLSHMLDVELFGLDAGGHHAMNAGLHLLAALLLFEVLRRMTGGTAPSAFVALLFALHPTRVESVAWVAERRDTLSAVFWMLTLAAYLAFVRRGGGGRYALLLAVFALGLLAKPMGVTLPFVLLLLDFWPLGRARLGARRLLLEKLPLLGLAALAAAAAYLSQGAGGAVASLEQVPLAARLGNALLAWAGYLRMAVWPVDLAVFYPYELEPPPARVAAAALLLAALSALAAWQWRRRPWLAVGWLWFLGTLLPVIGLVQIGSQALADRYTYLPFVGLGIALAWSGAEASGRWRPAVAGAAALALAASAGLARAQVMVWRDSVSLFEHARAVTGDNYVVEANLGEAFEDAGEHASAIEHYQAALELFRQARGIRTRLGRLEAARGQWTEASALFREEIRRHPEEIDARVELARLLLRFGSPEQAGELLDGALEREPDDARALFSRAELEARQGDEAAARQGFAAAFAADPTLPDEPVLDREARVCASLGQALGDVGRLKRARYWGRRALVLARLGGDAALAARIESSLASYPKESTP